MRAKETCLPSYKAMADAGKTKTGGIRCQNARFPVKPKWKAATLGIKTVVFGYGAIYTPDTFTKAYNGLVKYIGSGGLDKYGGPKAASALCKFEVPNFVIPKPL